MAVIAGTRELARRLEPVLSLVSWLYLAVLLCLAAWVGVVWAAFGWHPVVVVDAALAPSVRAGDVVLVGAPGEGQLSPGALVATGSPGPLVVARLEQVLPDGTYRVLGGDGVPGVSASLAPDDVRGVGRLLVPAIGAPLAWLRTGRGLLLGGAGLLTAAAALLALRPVRAAPA
jgi:hypothetical protein